MKVLWSFFKKRTVFCVSFILAVTSCFFVKPSAAYIDYIDFNTLALLFVLMAGVQGLTKAGVFSAAASTLCKKCGTIKTLAAVLVAFCFFSSMIITNDVALLTFVPFTVALVLMMDNVDPRTSAYIIVLETVAANTGSMLTPLGNPQNLFIYSKDIFTLPQFILTILPYSVLCAVLLAVSIVFIPSTKTAFSNAGYSENRIQLKWCILYLVLFIAGVLSVFHLINKLIVAAVVFLVLVILDRETLKQVDWFLLLTFIAFFIFSGNLAAIEGVKQFLSGAMTGHETVTSFLASQVVSNVPATLMLYPFAQDIKGLLTGVNIGGMGTLIGSLASLISFNIYNSSPIKMRYSSAKYLGLFTVVNVIYIIFCFGLRMFL